MSLRFVKDEVVSERGVVTASTPEAAGAGLRTLKLGGNVRLLHALGKHAAKEADTAVCHASAFLKRLDFPWLL